MEKHSITNIGLLDGYKKKTHTYEYFKAMSKEALITCLFQCEDYIKKLTTKKAGK